MKLQHSPWLYLLFIIVINRCWCKETRNLHCLGNDFVTHVRVVCQPCLRDLPIMQCCSLWCNTIRHQFTSTLLQLNSFTKLHMERFKYFHLQYMTNFINLHLAQHFLSSSPKQRWFVMNIYRAAKRKKIHRHHRQI